MKGILLSVSLKLLIIYGFYSAIFGEHESLLGKSIQYAYTGLVVMFCALRLYHEMHQRALDKFFEEDSVSRKKYQSLISENLKELERVMTERREREAKSGDVTSHHVSVVTRETQNTGHK